jgi:hypothetical protein
MLSDSFNLNLEISLAQASILPVIRELFREQAQEHMLFLGSEEDFSYTTTVDVALSQRSHLFAESINQTTFNQLQKVFEKTTTRQELIEGIKETYGNISTGRAEVIARTETHYALQRATLEGIQQSGVEWKIWVWAEGLKGGIRDDHLAIDGEERPAKEPFSNGLMFPGDGGPEDAVNCQCSLA